eukprot:CAMPEP_0173380972 /NCGR_PEP_ID=MMETSP1356-20130122/3501_1 /TAXON_ID=77927 ORGANISM="Hemiselmis virescens, Strain PCC157" /NCGR_SAMPLE_ID=MMETSP1356 /ASSEMBLY_ACC=CAM_ASM_000847 /LENGTH=541 /DNA_ID=CAMNT_0014334699 /DNA_START=133 /DNA_END=1760 /DNA_ORIENTATION=-
MVTTRQEEKEQRGGVDAKHAPLLIPVQVPTWISFVIIGMVLGTYWVSFKIAPLAFVDLGEKSSMSGFEGAVDVARKGAFPNYITAAIPCFLLMIGAEMVIMLFVKLPSSGGKKQTYWRAIVVKYVLADAWSSLSAGVVQQLVTTLVLKPAAIYTLPYEMIHQALAVRFGLALPIESPWTWIGALVLCDLAYYWLHRLAHEINILWAGHSVHHSSDHYNLATALRQSWFQGVAAPLYYLPMAIFFPTPVYMAMHQANIVSQFWIHTCLVRRLGPAEWILMTPSHHRVHHDRRVHKNFGGMFIIWDRMFGSFLDEEDAVSVIRENVSKTDVGEKVQEEVLLFGTRQNPTTWTEAVTQTMFWQPIVSAIQKGASLRDICRAALVGPGYSTAGSKRTLVVPSFTSVRIRSSSNLHPGGKAYVLFHFLLGVVVGFLVLIAKDGPWSLRCAAALYVIYTFYCHGKLLDCCVTARMTELTRCVAASIAMIWLSVPSSSFAPDVSDALAMTPIRYLLYILCAVHATSSLVLLGCPRAFAEGGSAHSKTD